jgi:hypothetical protein
MPADAGSREYWGSFLAEASSLSIRTSQADALTSRNTVIDEFDDDNLSWLIRQLATFGFAGSPNKVRAP